MRIALFNDDALPSARGGAAVIMDTLQKGYAARGHETVCITTHRDGTDIRRSGGMISLPSPDPRGSEHRRCLGTPEMRAALQEVLGAWKPDAVHAQNVHHHLTYESLAIARSLGARTMLTAHDTLLVSCGRVRSFRYLEAAKRGGTIRMHWWEHLADGGRKYWPLRNPGIRHILKTSGTQVMAISEAVAAFLRANGIGVSAVIPNGIERWEGPAADAIDAFRKYHGVTGPSVLFAGRIREDKGIRALFAAADRVLHALPAAQFIINGETEHLAGHLEYATQRVRNAVISTGWLSREETMKAYSAADVVTVPSLYLDNFPTVNLEAMAAGKPVVGTCFGGTPEIVADGETGVIVDPRDTHAYAEALTGLLLHPERAKTMGEAGRRRVRERYTVEQQVDAYLRLLAA